MPTSDTLPEGTDTIIEGAGVSSDGDDGMDESGDTMTDPMPEAGATTATQAIQGTRAMLLGKLDGLTGQATDKAHDLVQAGKDRAIAAIDDVARMIEDAASEIDAKVGTQYGDYARRAAGSVGELSRTLNDKEVDTLLDDARDLISKSPAAAIGIAAVAGFVIARLLRAGIGATNAATDHGAASEA